ncbi:hypothetical protein [Nocardioides terrae]|nr:hypothetical protein [Nocardioides terrae]
MRFRDGFRFGLGFFTAWVVVAVVAAALWFACLLFLGLGVRYDLG